MLDLSVCFPAFNRKESFIDRNATISKNVSIVIQTQHTIAMKTNQHKIQHVEKQVLSLKHEAIKIQNENFKQILLLYRTRVCLCVILCYFFFHRVMALLHSARQEYNER